MDELKQKYSEILQLAEDFLNSSRGSIKHKSYTSQQKEEILSKETRCPTCNSFLKKETLTVEHPHPKCLGGKNTDNNMLPMCDICNTARNHVMTDCLGGNNPTQIRKRWPAQRLVLDQFLIWSHATLDESIDYGDSFIDLDQKFEEHRKAVSETISSSKKSTSKKSTSKKSTKQLPIGAKKYRCLDCGLEFSNWSTCKRHLIDSNHMNSSNTKGLQQRAMRVRQEEEVRGISKMWHGILNPAKRVARSIMGGSTAIPCPTCKQRLSLNQKGKKFGCPKCKCIIGLDGELIEKSPVLIDLFRQEVKDMMDTLEVGYPISKIMVELRERMNLHPLFEFENGKNLKAALGYNKSAKINSVLMDYGYKIEYDMHHIKSINELADIESEEEIFQVDEESRVESVKKMWKVGDIQEFSKISKFNTNGKGSRLPNHPIIARQIFMKYMTYRIGTSWMYDDFKPIKEKLASEFDTSQNRMGFLTMVPKITPYTAELLTIIEQYKMESNDSLSGDDILKMKQEIEEIRPDNNWRETLAEGLGIGEETPPSKIIVNLDQSVLQLVVDMYRENKIENFDAQELIKIEQYFELMISGDM